MLGIDIHQILENLSSPRVIWTVLWSGVGLLTLSLMVLMRTRWGQAKPLSKCIVLSVFVHVLLVGYAHMTHLFIDYPTAEPDSVKIKLVMQDKSEEQQAIHRPKKPWEDFATESIELAVDATPAREPIRLINRKPSRKPIQPPTISHQQLTDNLPDADITKPIAESSVSVSSEPAKVLHTEIEAPKPERNESPEYPSIEAENLQLARENANFEMTARDDYPDQHEFPDSRSDPATQLQRLVDEPESERNAEFLADAEELLDEVTQQNTSHPVIQTPARMEPPSPELTAKQTPSQNGSDPQSPPLIRVDSSPKSTVEVAMKRPDGGKVPELYQSRVSGEREKIIEKHGGDDRTEASVQAALMWLAANQGPDGRWDASELEAGNETVVAGHNRQGAGAEADTGITALALLAFLGSGETHLKGKYRKNVQHGLEFLLRSQKANGDLAGKAKTFAAMYCHGMATLALCEAFAMTGDLRMKAYVQRAVNFSVSAQHTVTGGWRYRPGDLGDMSQFGWQVMALKSAELAGISIPDKTKQGMKRFLKSVSTGNHGGLACYRPNEKISPTMTGEALACRFFLGSDRNAPAIKEATDYLLLHPPNRGKTNLYYCYYATLGLYQTQDKNWDQWNQMLQNRLLAAQRQDGLHKGSWDPDTVWGSYGGRVYSTALAALCMEVYYRFLPILE